MAYGTATILSAIRSSDRNAWVTRPSCTWRKTLLVPRDLPAGPTEMLVIAG